MPRISEFHGIVIKMYHREHQPSHFHAIYAEFEAVISIQSIEILSGRLPSWARSLVLEWAELHQRELDENWQLARDKESLKRIAPLN